MFREELRRASSATPERRTGEPSWLTTWREVRGKMPRVCPITTNSRVGEGSTKGE